MELIPELARRSWPMRCTRTHRWYAPFTARWVGWSICRSENVPRRRRPPTAASRGLGQKISRFARSCAGELILPDCEDAQPKHWFDRRAPGETRQDGTEHTAGYVRHNRGLAA